MGVWCNENFRRGTSGCSSLLGETESNATPHHCVCRHPQGLVTFLGTYRVRVPHSPFPVSLAVKPLTVSASGLACLVLRTPTHTLKEYLETSSGRLLKGKSLSQRVYLIFETLLHSAFQKPPEGCACRLCHPCLPPDACLLERGEPTGRWWRMP